VSASGPALEPGSTRRREQDDAATVDGVGRSRPSSPTPERVGRYVILSMLGEGGMGVVLEAFDPELDRRVAIKLLHPLRGSVNASRRLLREAQVMARLSHPNVVQVHDAGELGTSVFVAMELVRGQTMRAWMRATKPHWREVVAKFIEAGRGLAAAHDAGIVHRDFKPDNMLIGADGRVRVADFGLANVAFSRDPEAADPAPRAEGLLPITATGAVMGTPMYMAPEQHAGLPVGPAADQFGFCVALHEAVFGRRPFAGHRSHEIAQSVLAGEFTAPPMVPAEQRWVLEVVRRGVAVDPERRFASFRELLAALDRDPSARRRLWRNRLAAAGLVAASGVAALRASTEPCTGGRASIEQVWSSEARADLVRSVDAEAQGRASALVSTLDRYAERWGAAHRDTCLAHRRDELSSDLLDRSMACLLRRRAAIAKILDLVHDGGPAVRAGATAAAAALPAISECSDPESVDLRIPRPADPSEAAAIEAGRVRLVEAEVLHHAGDVDVALPELAEVASQAEALGATPLSAEVALSRGRLALDRMDQGEAADAFAEAAILGVEAGLDRIAAEALIRKLYVDASRSTEPARVLEDAPMARAQLRRAGEPAALAALLANNLGVIHGLVGDRALARAAFTEALELGDHDDANPGDVAGIALNLALLTPDADRREALFDRAAALLRDRLGPDHLMLLEIEARRAETTAALDLATLRTRAVCDAFDARVPDDLAQRHQCRWRLAALLDEGEAVTAAIAELDRGLADLDAPVAEIDAEYVAAQRSKTRGHRAVLAGDPDAAIAELDRARAALAPHASAPWIALELADVDRLTGRALLALGRDAQARARLEAALAVYVAERGRTEDRAVRAHADEARALLTTLAP